MKTEDKRRMGRWLSWLALPTGLVLLAAPMLTRTPSKADEEKSKPKQGIPSSYDQIAPALVGKESFQAMLTRDKAEKDEYMARQKKLLEERYELASRPDDKVTMSRGKPIQVGPAVKLPEG